MFSIPPASFTSLPKCPARRTSRKPNSPAALREEAERAAFAGRLTAAISVPGGKELAEKTFNPPSGVQGLPQEVAALYRQPVRNALRLPEKIPAVVAGGEDDPFCGDRHPPRPGPAPWGARHQPGPPGDDPHGGTSKKKKREPQGSPGYGTAKDKTPLGRVPGKYNYRLHHPKGEIPFALVDFL